MSVRTENKELQSLALVIYEIKLNFVQKEFQALCVLLLALRMSPRPVMAIKPCLFASLIL